MGTEQLGQGEKSTVAFAVRVVLLRPRSRTLQCLLSSRGGLLRPAMLADVRLMLMTSSRHGIH